MNEFKKYELEFLKWCVLQAKAHNPPIKGSTYVEGFTDMYEKIKSMIDNYCDPKNVQIVGTGQLLFYNKYAESALIQKISKQISLCENDDENKLFRIDWRILFGEKFKNE